MYFSFNKLIFRENHMEKIISKPHPKVHKVQSNFQIDKRLNQVLYRPSPGIHCIHTTCKHGRTAYTQ